MRYGATHRWYARFYGNYDTLTGKRKRFSFQVRVSPAIQRNRRALSEFIRTTCNNLLDRNIPEHEQGETFHTFGDLLRRTRWFRVRKVRNYEAGVLYER